MRNCSNSTAIVEACYQHPWIKLNESCTIREDISISIIQRSYSEKLPQKMFAAVEWNTIHYLEYHDGIPFIISYQHYLDVGQTFLLILTAYASTENLTFILAASPFFTSRPNR